MLWPFLSPTLYPAVRQEKRLAENKGRQDSQQWLVLLKIQDTNSAIAVYVGKRSAAAKAHTGLAAIAYESSQRAGLT